MSICDGLVYGPVVLSGEEKAVLVKLCSESRVGEPPLSLVLPLLASAVTLNKEMTGWQGFPLSEADFQTLETSLRELITVWGPDYPLDIILDIANNGFQSHAKAGDLEIDRKFETGESGGSDVPKVFRRLANPFGPHIVDGYVAAKVIVAYDGTQGNIVKLLADTVVRPVCQPPGTADNFMGSIIPTPTELRLSREKAAAYRVASEAIDARVEKYISEKSSLPTVMTYSAAPYQKDGSPRDNLDEVAVMQPFVIFQAFADDDRRDFKSEILKYPTWLEVCLQFNNALHVTRDFHHCFLEGIKDTGEYSSAGIPIYSFLTGS